MRSDSGVYGLLEKEAVNLPLFFLARAAQSGKFTASFAGRLFRNDDYYATWSRGIDSAYASTPAHRVKGPLPMLLNACCLFRSHDHELSLFAGT